MLRNLMSTGLLAAVAFALALAGMLWSVSNLRAASAREDRADQRVVAAAAIRTNALRMQSAIRGYLLTGSPIYLTERRLEQSTHAAIRRLRPLADDPGDLRELASIHRRYDAWMNSAIRHFLLHPLPRGVLISPATLRQSETDSLNRTLTAFLDRQHRIRLVRSDATDAAARIMVITSAVATLLICGGLGLVGWTAAARRAALEQAKRRADALEAQNLEMREAARMKNQFVASVSHEFRTPLTAILGLTELLLDEKAGTLTPEQHRRLRDVHASGRHLLALINDVLDLARAQSTRLPVELQRCEVRRLTREAAETLRPLAEAKGLTLEVEADGRPLEARTDSKRVKQLLYNYLSNAIKFTNAPGKVRVRVSADAFDHFRIEVRDTGIGIPQADISRLFVEFTQLHSARGKAQDGSGLGLAMTKRIAEALGGSVGVESGPGGSTFFAILPRDTQRLGLTTPGAA